MNAPMDSNALKQKVRRLEASASRISQEAVLLHRIADLSGDAGLAARFWTASRAALECSLCLTEIRTGRIR